jgi:hypothetical protein
VVEIPVTGKMRGLMKANMGQPEEMENSAPRVMITFAGHGGDLLAAET